MKFNLINFVKETDSKSHILKENKNYFNSLTEKYLIIQHISIKFIKYLLSVIIFFKKIIVIKHLEKLSKLKINYYFFSKIFKKIFIFFENSQK